MSVPILTYHSLDTSGSVISVSPDDFRSHMGSLHARGYRAVALGDLLDSWDSGAPDPPRTVVVTFDDAFRSVFDEAAPVLADLGFRATVFAVAGHVGGTNDWPSQAAGVPNRPLCSWGDLRGLAAGAFEIGAHGMAHAPLDGAAADVERREIEDAHHALQDGLGRAVHSFAFPYGVASASARDRVRARYRAACSVELREASVSDDRHWLPRLDVYYLRRPRLFRSLGTPAGDAYLKLRSLGRSARGRLATPYARTARGEHRG